MTREVYWLGGDGNWYSAGHMVSVPLADPGVPVAAFSVSMVNLTVTFDATSSSSTVTNLIDWVWDYGDPDPESGDPSTDQGQVVSHTYPAPGNYQVELTVLNAGGATNTVYVTVPVNTSNTGGDQTNLPPIAKFTINASNLVVTTDASASSDPDGQIVDYFWTWGDTGPQLAGLGQLSVSVHGSGNQAPTASITSFTSSGLTTNWVGAGADADGSVALLSWNFGDGSPTVTGSNQQHVYAQGGSYAVTLTATDNLGATGFVTRDITVSGPTSAFTFSLNSDKVTESFIAIATPSPSAKILTYDWNYGDGTAHGSGVTSTHTYAASGPFTVTLTVTDTLGLSAVSSQVVNPVAPVVGPPAGSAPVWSLGNGPSDGIPVSVPVYTFTNLGLSTSVTDMQTVVNALQNSSKAAGIIALPKNWTGYINNFAHNGTNYGIYASKLMGLLGDTTGGTMNTRVIVAPGAETLNQATTLGNTPPVTTSNTTAIAAYRIANTSAHYIGGIQFIGNDQVQATEPVHGHNGPAIWGGFALNHAGNNSIFQNNLLQGFGRADYDSPPGEVGNWSEAHTVGLTFRYVEHDGMIPVGSATRPNSSVSDPYGMSWRRGGGVMWNAASNFLMQDVYSHDTWASGVTMSFTSLPTSTGSETNNWSSRRIKVANNAAWPSPVSPAQGSGQVSHHFSPLNHEFNWGTIHHYQPDLDMNNFSSPTDAHLKLWVYTTDFGAANTADPNMQMYIHQPTWHQSQANDHGMFSVYIAGYSSNKVNVPIVYLTSADEAAGTAATPCIVRAGTDVWTANGGQYNGATTANKHYVVKYS